MKLFATDFTVYPILPKHPQHAASDLGHRKAWLLTIIDMKGQQVYYRDLGMLPGAKTGSHWIVRPPERLVQLPADKRNCPCRSEA